MNLILIRGLPGSGKTTLANQLMYHFMHLTEAKMFEADMYFMQNGKYVFDRKLLGHAHKWCQDSTDDWLSKDGTAIVSNTFTTVRELSPYFEIAKKYEIVPTVYACQNDWGSIHNVPLDTMISMKNRFQYDISSLFKDFF